MRKPISPRVVTLINTQVAGSNVTYTLLIVCDADQIWTYSFTLPAPGPNRGTWTLISNDLPAIDW
jgi:hypothetical protein